MNKDVNLGDESGSEHKLFFIIQIVLIALLIIGLWVLMNNNGPVGDVQEFIGGLR